MIAEQAHEAIFPMEGDEYASQLLLLGDRDHEIEEMGAKGMPLPVIDHQEGDLANLRICLPIQARDADQFSLPVGEAMLCDQDDVLVQVRMANALEAGMVDARVQWRIREVTEADRLIGEMPMQDRHMRLIIRTDRAHGNGGPIIQYDHG